MGSDITARERLAADLELLGTLGDPSRGPLASLFTLDPPQAAAPAVTARPARSGARWRRGRAALLASIQRLRAIRPESASPPATSPATPHR